MSLIIPALVSSILFLNPVFAQTPHVDFDRMGRVALVGAFAGLDIFQNSSVAYDPATSTLFTRTAQGALTRLASTSTGGRILAGCQLDDTFYFAGLFSSVDGIDASNIASYSPSDKKFNALKGGVNGEVEALFCDPDERKVWVGGSFSSPAAAVSLWNPRSSEWEQPPFGGLTGAQAKVSSITTNSTNASIFFAGSFITNFGSPRPLNASGNPNVPNSPGASPFSTSLVPIPLQSIPGVEIVAGPQSNQAGFNDIRNTLCPAGDDGPGNTWFAADSSTAKITIRAFSFISASGIRLGNTFQDDRGTTSFSVTTIPDNGPRELRYVDPVSGENRTCTETCPLSTDRDVLYQDFLFNDALPLTGIEIQLTGFNGASAGLHILQLLSSGAFASALEENNGVSCYAPNGSEIQRTGDWAVKVANTDIAGTVQRVLVSSVQPATPVASRPTFTWIPYVGAAGNYDIYMLVPGCTNFQDCDRRTNVQVVVFPGEGLAPNVMTVPQQNRDDTSVKIYTGPILPSSPEFVTTITMSLADDPAGPVEIVADRVQLVLRSANASLSDSGNGTTAGSQRGFGFLEWPRDSSVTADATNALPNTTITALDSVGFDMLDGLGGRLVNGPLSINTVAHHSSGAIFLGGNFNLSSGSATGASNIAMFRNGALATLADGGLDGAVSSLVLEGDLLFVGGAFRDTSAGSLNGLLRGVAVYNVQANSWSALNAGVNGQVTELGLSNGRVQVLGNFTQILSSENDFTIPAGGLAAWDVGSSSWVNVGGFAAGRMTLIADGADDMQFIAGNVVSARQYGASGMVMLQNGNDAAVPQVTPLGVGLGSGPQPTAASPSSGAARRHLKERAKRSWHSHLHLPSIFARQSPSSDLPALPPLPISPAPAVLAGTFWKNGSSEVAILGGNFTFYVPGSTTAYEGVAIYNPDSSTVRGLQGDQPNGVIRAILVDGDNLFVGGEFTLANNNVNGIAIYNLAKDEWDLSSLQTLQAASGSSVVVRSITKSPAQGSIIVAGSFARAGSLNCQAICSLDIASKQWDSLGNGVNGEVASIAYADDALYAGGSLMLENNAGSNVLQYTFGNSSWAAVGSDLPGPVTAIELNNGNSSSIFAAGSEESGAPFLAYWNGANWSRLESTLGAETTISQIAMVPLQNNHDEQGVIQSDRVLMVSGSLVDSTHGNVSAALYDGKNIIPYIIASTSSGSSGYVSSLFRSVAKFSFDQRKFLAVGVVILISIAIAAGVVFLLALIGILWTLFARKDDKNNKFEGEENEEDSTNHRPSSLLEHINAATRTTIMGAASPYNDYSDKDDKSRSEHDPFGPDAGGFARAETPSDMAGGLMAEEMSRPAHARYSFDGHGEGELPISAGEELEVLDDRDPAWWYARHVRTGREGVVPASYLY